MQRRWMATGLGADPAYVDALERQSTWPMRYVMTQRQRDASSPAYVASEGPRERHVGAGQIVDFNRLLPAHSRAVTLAKHHKLNTELFGTAPYVALGRGTLRDVDSSTRLRDSAYTQHDVPRGTLAMSPFWSGRFQDDARFVGVAPARLPLEADRIGESTRVAPVYAAL